MQHRYQTFMEICVEKGIVREKPFPLFLRIMFTVCRNGDKSMKKTFLTTGKEQSRNGLQACIQSGVASTRQHQQQQQHKSVLCPFRLDLSSFPPHSTLPLTVWLVEATLSQGRRMHLTRALAWAPVHSAALFEWYTFETRPISGTRPTPWALLAALSINSCWALCMMAWSRFFVRALGLQEVSVEVALLAEHAMLFKCGWIRL